MKIRMHCASFECKLRLMCLNVRPSYLCMFTVPPHKHIFTELLAFDTTTR